MSLLDDLRAAKSYYELAPIFGAAPKRLASLLYSSTPRGYRVFEIPKKSGGHRQIESPTGLRRIVQKRLKEMMSDVYRPPECAHGFVRYRSVRTNAAPHVGKKTVINVDLENFFHAVSFARVRGIFLSNPFFFNWTVSNVLAQALCFDGRLPMGGPCSPVISNYVLSALDKALLSFTERNGGRYSRYCDDLTLSFDRLPGALTNVIKYSQAGTWSLLPAIEDLISEQGFKVNQKKFRVRFGSSRKSVAGVVVNQKINVPRRWIHDLEKCIFLAEKWGWKSAAEKYISGMEADAAAHVLKRRVHGKLAYLHMIRGGGDWLVSDMAHRFNAISDSQILRVPDVEQIALEHRYKRAVFVVHCFDRDVVDYLAPSSQGTAFCITNGGLLITAAHVIKPVGGDASLNVYLHNEFAPNKRLRCEIVLLDEPRDIAILRTTPFDHSFIRSRFAIGDPSQVNDVVKTVGYPDYIYGNTLQLQAHQVTALPVVSAVKKIRITGDIRGGLSGAPALNAAGRVVGIVHRGVLMSGHANELVSAQMLLESLDQLA